MHSPLNSFLMLRCILMWLCLCTVAFVQGQGYILISMDENQTNHMKAYGITYQVLEAKQEAYWLLNYEGGSFAFQYHEIFKKECIRRGVSFKIIPTASFNSILSKISSPEVNMEAMKQEVAPKIAVYSPTVNVRGNEVQPWDDAVTLVLTYAEIPYDLVYDDEVLAGKLNNTIGCICITRISPDNLVSFSRITATKNGTKTMFVKWKHWPKNTVMKKYLNSNLLSSKKSENLYRAVVLCLLCVRLLTPTI